MRQYSPFAAVLFFSLSLFSCDLDHFDLNKLAEPTDIVPEVYAPLAYGSYMVDDLPSGPKPNDSDVLTPDGLLFTVLLDKTSTSFRSSAVDSVYLMITMENKTAADIEFQMTFENGSGPRLFTSDLFSIVSGESRAFEIPLGPSEQDRLKSASTIGLNFRLEAPSSKTITYGEVKDDSLSVKIGFHALVEFWKL